MRYLLLILFLSGCYVKTETTEESMEPRFTFGESVEIIKGFYKGQCGNVTGYSVFYFKGEYYIKMKKFDVGGWISEDKLMKSEKCK